MDMWKFLVLNFFCTDSAPLTAGNKQTANDVYCLEMSVILDVFIAHNGQ